MILKLDVIQRLPSEYIIFTEHIIQRLCISPGLELLNRQTRSFLR